MQEENEPSFGRVSREENQLSGELIELVYFEEPN